MFTEINITIILDLIGTFAFAISGIRLASGKNIDWFGAYIVGLITAIGGGTTRDVLLGETPFWMLDAKYVITTAVALLVTLLFRGKLVRWGNALFAFDAIGLGLFTIVGISVSMDAGLPFWVCVVMGGITGTVGGVFRDVLINEIPLIFRRDIYALASITGGIVYFICFRIGISMPLSEVIAALTVITIRIVSVKFHIHLPTLKSIGSNDQSMILILGITFFTTGWLVPATPAMAQAVTGSEHQWIRPADGNDPAIWGIRDGIVFGLWPYGIESGQDAIGGGPRGLIRVGYAAGDQVYMLNFIAVEPVVNGTMEFSEISPSQVDGRWGKLMWAGDHANAPAYRPFSISRGVITHPDPANPAIAELSLYLFMEQFLNGAHPYLRISIRSDRPEELGLEIFHHEDSAPMERCALTATMGNYGRLRLLYLKDRVIDARQLYEDYNDIHFVEKEGYPVEEFLKDENGDFIVIAAGNESFAELSAWPQEPAYQARWTWRYRPFFKVTQYWRKESSRFDPSLHVRVNGRAKYWSGGSGDKSKYIDIPGGPAFENFELREKYHPGQKFFFGITRKPISVTKRAQE